MIFHLDSLTLASFDYAKDKLFRRERAVLLNARDATQIT
jgi:hypothetical protein